MVYVGTRGGTQDRSVKEPPKIDQTVGHQKTGLMIGEPFMDEPTKDDLYFPLSDLIDDVSQSVVAITNILQTCDLTEDMLQIDDPIQTDALIDVDLDVLPPLNFYCVMLFLCRLPRLAIQWLKSLLSVIQ